MSEPFFKHIDPDDGRELELRTSDLDNDTLSVQIDVDPNGASPLPHIDLTWDDAAKLRDALDDWLDDEESVDITSGTGEHAEKWGEWFKCPKCDQNDIAVGHSYCPNCGVAIDWIPS